MLYHMDAAILDKTSNFNIDLFYFDQYETHNCENWYD